jgi:hypothetical protein
MCFRDAKGHADHEHGAAGDHDAKGADRSTGEWCKLSAKKSEQCAALGHRPTGQSK